MELHMREQSRQVDQERWRLSQEESRLKALQSALEDERRITMEQLSSQRAEVQRARERSGARTENHHDSDTKKRRSLATERAQLSSAHRDLISREKMKTETSVQAEADLGATAVRIKEDTAALSVREAQDAGRARDEGEQALELAERVRVNAEGQRAESEGMFLVVQEKERQLAQFRVCQLPAIRDWEKRERGKEATSLISPYSFFFIHAVFLPYLNPIAPVHFKARFLCVAKCNVYVTRIVLLSRMSGVYWRRTSRQGGVGSARDGEPVLQNRYMLQIRPQWTRQSYPPLLQMSAPGTPDLLVNTLELKRTLRKWSHDKEKDEEFLEQEAQFLNRLQRSRDTSKLKSSTSQNSTVY
ncbi:establishment of epithelial cell polarity [Desmophyllum pertusum]|uniref:Establishment of epithelial cell polarity n=1 Tax=Desmophyllum pertusum TaxID=174260 RepID=A0A9W9Z797_9CNID|nr:establishment of epithelial cell polarity [Desmophyllum pertusum]